MKETDINKTVEKNYIIFYNGRVGYVNVCKCDKCKERKQYEWFINDLNDEYLDCVKPEDISKEVLYIGTNLAKGIEELNNYHKNELLIKTHEVNFLQSVIDVYKKELFESVDKIEPKRDLILKNKG